MGESERNNLQDTYNMQHQEPHPISIYLKMRSNLLCKRILNAVLIALTHSLHVTLYFFY